MSEIDVKALKDKVNLIDYVKQYYPNMLKIEQENGSYAKCKCLWHQDKDSPSLTFFSNGTYKCFGCGKYGDIISLVKDIEGVDFQNACKIIGDNIGFDVQLTPANPHYEQYKNMMEGHCSRYESNYENDLVAQDYLENKRHLTKEIIKEFRLGVTDIDEYKIRKDIGGISHRISFPIMEAKSYNARCLAMGYRALNDEKPKYINDHNQDGRPGQDINYNGVFVKGNCIYGFSNAYKYIKQYRSVVLTEGYVDVLSLHQSGIKNAVSVMGTAITNVQMDILGKVTNNIILLLDSDNAGINAMIKILPELFARNFNIRICIFEGGLDPADVCVKYNFDFNTVSSLIRNNSVAAEQYLINNAVKDYERYVFNKRKEIINNLVPIISCIPNQVTKELCMKELNKRLDL